MGKKEKEEEEREREREEAEGASGDARCGWIEAGGIEGIAYSIADEKNVFCRRGCPGARLRQ